MSVPYCDMQIRRLHKQERLITGTRTVNGEPIGTTGENDDVEVKAGTYMDTSGIVRSTISCKVRSA